MPAIMYIDLDCFYVQGNIVSVIVRVSSRSAEIFRRPELRGKPVVIQQVQHGGFIAISYEARAKGIRRGDGIGVGADRFWDHTQSF